MFKVETHLHTTVISPCGRVTPEQIVMRYKEAGYDGLIVTDHYQLEAFRFAGIDLDGPGDKLEAFLEGYRQVKAFADRVGMKTYYGAELEFTENRNHYLLYGFSPQLLADPARVCAMGIAEFSELACKDGALLIKAHPYRDRCVPVAPYLVDGIEAVNRHDKHMMPYGRGNIDFDEVMKALAQVGYTGLFNLEIPGEFNAPLEIRMAKLKYIKYLCEAMCGSY